MTSDGGEGGISVSTGKSCSLNNGGCSHECVDKDWGALCLCPLGFKLSSNGAVCEGAWHEMETAGNVVVGGLLNLSSPDFSFEGNVLSSDVNECAPPSAPCAHHCINTVGSYHCRCKEGFRLEENATCVAAGKRRTFPACQERTSFLECPGKCGEKCFSCLEKSSLHSVLS